jgi:hypothetical protein
LQQSTTKADTVNATADPSLYHESQKLTFEQLPDEMLLHIIKAFEIDAQDISHLRDSIALRTALSKLALCSRKLNALATPALYGTLIQTRTTALPGFMKAMLEKPERQKYVKKIITSNLPEGLTNTKCLTNYSYDEQRPDPPGFRPDKSKMENIIAARGLAVDDRVLDWGDEIMDGSWEALLAVLLCIMCELEELTLLNLVQFGSEEYGGYLRRPFEYSTSPSHFAYPWLEDSPMPAPSLTKLHTVRLHTYSEPLSLRGILPLVTMPSLSMLSLDGLTALDEDYGYSVERMIQQLAKGAPNIKRLDLGDFMMDKKYLKDFLGCFKHVEHLTYGHGGGNWQKFEMPLLKTALEPLQANLKSLDLSGPGFFLAGHGMDLTNVPIDTRIYLLQDFPKLQHLTLDSHMIFGHDDNLVDLDDVDASSLPLLTMLPPTVKSLEIKIADAAVILHVTALIERKKEIVPNLRRVALHLIGWNDARLGVLEGICRKHGVICKVRKLQSSS